MRKLTSVAVKGLLGSYDHAFEFPAEDEFVILHGPNGVGKTRLLELIDDVMRGRVPGRSTPFSSVRLGFDDGAWLEVQRDEGTTRWASSSQPTPRASRLGDDNRAMTSAVRDLMEQGLIRRVPGTLAARPIFRDAETAERLTEAEALDRYIDDVDPAKLPVPPEVRNFVRDLHVSSVEVNRLRYYDDDPTSRHDPRFRERPQLSAVEYYARELARLITRERSSHAIYAQKLDGTYPQRLLDGTRGNADLDTVRQLQAQLGTLRTKLEASALLEVDESLVGLDVAALDDDWKLAALELHYEDSLEKLKQLEPIADRINLFNDLISSKLTGKVLHLSADDGFVVETPSSRISLSDLSSGEQHELVMTYRLIFDSRKSQLVLIDEPEVSLHVHWQRQFLDDLQRIAQLDGLRFIIATHSPQIVGRWVRRMVSLGQAGL